MITGEISGIVTILFTDVEGSTRLWEREPDQMRAALARHDVIARAAVQAHRGIVVKTTGDGIHAVFDDPLDAVEATLKLQQALLNLGDTGGTLLRVRCGLHLGVVERRDNDVFGTPVNRTARIMAAAHGGQVLVSKAVADLICNRLPNGVALKDLGAVRLRDLASPERVYQVVHPQLRQDFPALRSLEATPNNLPQQLTSFIGRERQQAEVKALLGSNRLVTLVGVGGIGKTRLALQAAADVLDEHPDGVWLVELAPLTDPRLVPQALASVVGVKEEAGPPVQEALVKFVADRQLLLVLDNCEHLVQACAELALRLLQSGPRVKILATSREHLNVTGETIHAVPPLAIPQPERNFMPAELAQYEATRLFVERAMAAQPAFRLTEQNTAAVADVCQRLDGIPLALELAAARVRALSVEEIAARLTDRFGLLTRGDRTALPRQQTLRALIDWSYDLLTERERALLRRLAVFAGGFTLDAAEAVGAGGLVAGADVLDALTRLVEKSLVVPEPDIGRYRLLETMRQYAHERVREAGEGDETRGRHLRFYTALANEAEQKLQGPEQGAWLARLDPERENLLSAHAWCDHVEGGAQLGLEMVHDVELYWSYRGLLTLGQRVTVEALARAGARRPTHARCRALVSAANLSYWMGRYSEARGHAEEALAIARELGGEARLAGVLRIMGRMAQGQGDLATARAHLEESIAIARQVGDPLLLAGALNPLAELRREEGDLEGAEPLYTEALALRRALGDSSNVAVNLLNLAMIAIAHGAGDRARAMLLEAVVIAEQTGSRRMGQAALEVAAALGAGLGQWDDAAWFYGAAERQLKEMHIRRAPVDEESLAPLMARVRDALGVPAFAQAEATGHAGSYEEAMAEARTWLENRT